MSDEAKLKYGRISRTILGQLKSRMRRTGDDSGRIKRTLKDGTVIIAQVLKKAAGQQPVQIIRILPAPKIVEKIAVEKIDAWYPGFADKDTKLFSYAGQWVAFEVPADPENPWSIYEFRWKCRWSSSFSKNGYPPLTFFFDGAPAVGSVEGYSNTLLQDPTVCNDIDIRSIGRNAPPELHGIGAQYDPDENVWYFLAIVMGYRGGTPYGDSRVDTIRVYMLEVPAHPVTGQVKNYPTISEDVWTLIGEFEQTWGVGGIVDNAIYLFQRTSWFFNGDGTEAACVFQYSPEYDAAIAGGQYPTTSCIVKLTIDVFAPTPVTLSVPYVGSGPRIVSNDPFTTSSFVAGPNQACLGGGEVEEPSGLYERMSTESYSFEHDLVYYFSFAWVGPGHNTLSPLFLESHITETLSSTTDVYTTVSSGGGVVLYENDIADVHNFSLVSETLEYIDILLSSPIGDWSFSRTNTTTTNVQRALTRAREPIDDGRLCWTTQTDDFSASQSTDIIQKAINILWVDNYTGDCVFKESVSTSLGDVVATEAPPANGTGGYGGALLDAVSSLDYSSNVYYKTLSGQVLNGDEFTSEGSSTLRIPFYVDGPYSYSIESMDSQFFYVSIGYPNGSGRYAPVEEYIYEAVEQDEYRISQIIDNDNSAYDTGWCGSLPGGATLLSMLAWHEGAPHTSKVVTSGIDTAQFVNLIDEDPEAHLFTYYTSVHIGPSAPNGE